MPPPTDDTPDILGSDSGLETQAGAPAAEPGTATPAPKTASVDWERRYNELHSFHGRQTNELGALRRTVEELTGRIPKEAPKPPPPIDDAEARLFVHRLSTRPDATLSEWFGKREETLKTTIREEYQKALQEQLATRDDYIARQQIAALRQQHKDFDSLLDLGVRELVQYGVPMDKALELVRAANQGKLATKKSAAPTSPAVPKAVAASAEKNGKRGAKSFREAWEQAGAENED